MNHNLKHLLKHKLSTSKPRSEAIAYRSAEQESYTFDNRDSFDDRRAECRDLDTREMREGVRTH